MSKLGAALRKDVSCQLLLRAALCFDAAAREASRDVAHDAARDVARDAVHDAAHDAMRDGPSRA